MKTCLFLIFTLFSAFGWGQASLVTFEKVYGGGGNDIFADIIQLKDTSYLILGSTENFYASSSDILLYKINKKGVLQWKKIIGLNGVEKAIKLVELNNSYGILAQTNSNPIGDYNLLYYNIDTIGNIRNQSQFGTSNWDFPNSIVLNEIDSSLLITCLSDNEISGVSNPSIFKISTTGAQLQTKQFSNNYFWSLNGLIKGNGVKYYSVVTTYENDALGNISLATISVTDNDINVDLIEFLDTLKQEARCISFFSDGNIAIGKVNQQNDTLHALSILKCDTLGTIIWEYERFVDYCVSTSSDIFSIQPLTANRLIVAGNYSSFSSPIGCPLLNFGGGGTDALNQIIDENGYYYSQGNFGWAGNDNFNKIIKTLDGGFISGGTTNSYTNGLIDIYIVKTDSTGKTINAINFIDNTLGVKATNNSDMYITQNSISKTIHFKNVNQKFDYKIYSLVGAIVQKGSIDSNNSDVLYDNLESSIYIIQLCNSNSTYSYKFCK